MSDRLLIPGTGGGLFRTSQGPLGSLAQILFEGGDQLLTQHADDPKILTPIATSGKLDDFGEPYDVFPQGNHHAA